MGKITLLQPIPYRANFLESMRYKISQHLANLLKEKSFFW